MGVGSIYSTSQKQKLNTRSSTETELVAVDDFMPQILWTKYFLDAQGYCSVHKLQQDNVNAIKMGVNGRSSNTKRTKHMKLRLFFIKDRIDSKEIDIEFCPTEMIRGYFFKKILQGRLLIFFKAPIMVKDL